MPEGQSSSSARWGLPLAPLPRRGFLVAVVLFGVALATRLPGLDTPRSFFFDEVLYWRFTAQVVAGQETAEPTRPVPTLIRAASLRLFGGFGVTGQGKLPATYDGGPIAVGGDRVAWRTAAGAIATAAIGDDCVLEPGPSIPTPFRPDALAVSTASIVASGTDGGQPVLVVADRRSVTIPLPAEATALATMDDVTLVSTSDGSLLRVVGGEPPVPIGRGGGPVVAVQRDATFWAMSPDGELRSFELDGGVGAEIEIGHGARGLAAPVNPERGVSPHAISVLVAGASGVSFVDPWAQQVSGVRAFDPSPLVAAGRSGTAWLVSGERADVYEPAYRSRVASVRLPARPDVLLSDEASGTVLAVAGEDVWCLGGRPTFAIRIGSAVAGAASVALAALLAMRLWGSAFVGAAAGLFLALDGLHFTASRIGMNDTYVTAFIVLGWFAGLTAFRCFRSARWRVGAAWSGVAGVSLGLGAATKWSAGFALGTLAVLTTVYGVRERWLRPLGLLPLLGATLAGLPAAVYGLAHLPFVRFGQSGGRIVEATQSNVIEYGAAVGGFHWLASPWYVWPFGGGAIRIYVGPEASRPEVWMAPNPVVFIGGAVGIVVLAALALRRRSANLAIVPLAFAAQLLPWAGIARPAFVYHYVPALPFAGIAFAWLVAHRHRGLPRWVTRLTVFVATCAAFALSAAQLPRLDA